MWNLPKCYFEGCIAEDFSKFCGFVAIHESFLCKIWGHGVLWCGKSEQSAKVFSLKIVFFTNLRKFSLSKVSHYTIHVHEARLLHCCAHDQHPWEAKCKHIFVILANLLVKYTYEFEHSPSHLQVSPASSKVQLVCGSDTIHVQFTREIHVCVI